MLKNFVIDSEKTIKEAMAGYDWWLQAAEIKIKK